MNQQIQSEEEDLMYENSDKMLESMNQESNNYNLVSFFNQGPYEQIAEQQKILHSSEKK